MKIGIDARLASYRRGLGNYVYNLVTEFRKIQTDHRFVVYVDSSMPPAELAQWQSGRLEIRVCPSGNYVLWEQLILPTRSFVDGIDLLHCPSGTAPLGLPRRIKLCLTVPDVMSLLPHRVLPSSPSAYQRLGRLYRAFIVPRAARRAAGLATLSDYSRRDIARYLSITPERVHVIHLAPNPAFRPLPLAEARAQVRETQGIRGEFVLALGGIDPRKNTGGVLRAFAAAKQRTGSPHQLVLVGIPRNGHARYHGLASQLGIADDVVLADFVSEHTLVALYNSATFFAYPSLYEGFGLPVLEAMACGVPVIASTTASVPEIAGDAAVLIDPIDVDELARAMARLFTDAELRHTLIERGLRRCRKFSWEKTARETLAVYVQCLRSRTDIIVP